MLYSRERQSAPCTTHTGTGLLTPASLCFGGHSASRLVKDPTRRMALRQPRSSSLRRALLGTLSLAFFLVALNPAYAQSAAKWNKRGQDARVREDYDAAYEAFRQAHLKKPADLRYTTHFETAKFQAAAAHVDRGRVLKQSGDIGGAVTEYTRALMIDPANQAAAQELTIIQGRPPIIPAPGQVLPEQDPSIGPPPGYAAANPATAPDARQAVTAGDSLAQVSAVAGPVTLQPVSNDPITLHMVEDTKNIYQAIGKAAGLNVLFDPEYTSKRIPVELTNVTYLDALRIVGTLANTFYKPVTGNTIFVAANTRQKRTDLDELAVQTFYLSNASQQNDANEILTAIRNILDPSVKVYLVPSQNAIVMRATPDQLLLMQKLLNDLDRAKPEVVVDVAVLEVNRDKVRNLGITLPTSFGLTPTTTTSSSTASTSGTSTSTGTTTTATTSSNLTLSNLSSLNSSNFAVTVGGGTVSALLTDADTRILQNPRIRATDGQRAQLKIGSKIPVATGSYSSTLSATASLGVQTQFTYLDVGVNIDMTPTVHYDREVSLKMKVEVLSEASQVTISGVVEPVIGQRSAEQVIQLKDGEPSILAGLLTKQDTRGVNGTPGLGEIPFFKFFFSTQSKEVQENEIVFIVIPHIVRESILTRLNTRAIDTGTSQSVELRRDPNFAADLNAPINPQPARVPTTSAAVAASAMIGQLAQQSQMPKPGTVVPGSAAAAAGQAAAAQQASAAPPGTQPVSLTLTAPTTPQTVGGTFQVAVMLSGAQDLFAVPMQLGFNPAVLQLVNVDAGDLLARDGQPVSIVHRDEGNGLVTVSTSRPPGVAGVNGQGIVAVLTFKSIAPGDSPLTFVKVGARNSVQANLPAAGSATVVHVK